MLHTSCADVPWREGKKRYCTQRHAPGQLCPPLPSTQELVWGSAPLPHSLKVPFYYPKNKQHPKDLYRWPAAFTLLRLGRTFQGRTSLKVAIKTRFKLTNIWKIKNKTWNSIIQMFLWPNGVVQHSWHVEPHLFRLAEAGTWGIPPHLELPGQPGLMLFVYQLFFPWEF